MDDRVSSVECSGTSVLLCEVPEESVDPIIQASIESEISPGDEKLCLTCGLSGAKISTFKRVGSAKTNSEPLINLLCYIISKPVVEVPLYSDVVCEKCFKSFELVAKLQYKLSEAFRDIIKNFSRALKTFAKSPPAHYPENQCKVLVLNDSDLRTSERGIFSKAISLASSKKKIKSTTAKPERKFHCSVCGKAFRAYSHMVEHMVGHTQEKPFKCDVCGVLTTTKSNLAKHIRRHTHEYICSICDKKLANQFSLQEHMLVHSNSRPYQCEYCDKTFVRDRDRKIHQKNHQVHLKAFECNICQKSFVLKSRLQRHMLVHDSERKFVCPVCNKRFARKDDLKCHERVHSGNKPYSCTECGKLFRFMSNCTNHMKSHTKETKRYCCNLCGVSFLTETKYNNHLETRYHKKRSSETAPTGKVFCDICKIGFTALEYELHKQTCEKNEKKRLKDDVACEQFSCSSCCAKFNSLNQLSEHTYHSHVNPEVLSQTSGTRVLLSSVENNTEIVGITPLESFSVTNDNVNMVVAVGNGETSLQIPFIQSTASVPHPLNLDRKTNSAVSEGHYPGNVLNTITASESINAIAGSESISIISESRNIISGNVETVVGPSVEPTTSVSSAEVLEHAEGLFKISEWDMSSFVQK